MSELYHVANKFCIEGDIVDINEYGNGLINKTYSVSTTKNKYIIQKINDYVFKNVNVLMENIDLVTKYIKKKKGNTLDLVKTKSNKLILNYKKEIYRCYIMKENSKSYEQLEDDALAIEVGKIIGQFQYDLVELDCNKIINTIPYFHDLRHRYIDLVKAFRALDDDKLKKETYSLFSILLNQYNDIMRLPYLFENHHIQKRICHYDTKLNNFLFCKNCKNCLIDLDTVMPGCSIYDFGDCARNIIVNVDEDENTKDIIINDKRLVYLVIGYLCIGKNYLNKVEINNLYESIKVITIELSIRFLTDYLEGNLYFSTTYESQNFKRALCQYNIYCKLLEEEARLKCLINTIYKRLTIIN